METQKQITLHRLTVDFVEVSTKETAEINGKKNVVDNHMVSSSNSPMGRKFVEGLDIPKNFITSIFDVWGDEPTVADPEMPKIDKKAKQEPKVEEKQ